jgi:excinuclease ABC subunit A
LEHNLKNVDLELPRDALIVMTGLSGSGKSSLAFDTIYAEGQRRYVESLSAYARQFLEMMQKPDVDQIDGLSPAISIEQKTTSRNPRSTVGTVTEIYDYMRLLFARVGVPYSPATGLPIESQTVSQMVDRVMALEEGTRLYLLAPIVRGRKGEYRKEFAELMKQGFQRVKVDGTFYEIADARPSTRNTSTTSTSWWTAWWCATTSPRAWPTASRPRCNWPTARDRRIRRQAARRRPTGPQSTSRTKPTSASSFPRSSPARYPASRFPKSSRGCSPSTIRSAPAQPATALAPAALRARPGRARQVAVADARAPSHPGRRPATPRPTTRRRSMRSCKHYGFSMSTPWDELPKMRCKRHPVRHRMKRSTFVYDDGLRTYKTTKPFEGVIGNLERRWRETDSSWVREEIALPVRHPCRGLQWHRLKPEALAVKINGLHISRSPQMSIRKARNEWFDDLPGHLSEKQTKSPRASSRKSASGCASSTMSASTTSPCRAPPARCRAAKASASGSPRRSAPA